MSSKSESLMFFTSLQSFLLVDFLCTFPLVPLSVFDPCVLASHGLKTGVAEEILFRGFFAKKLFEIFHFRVGNIIQALIFALPHIISISKLNWIDTSIRIINAFIIGIVFGYVMEKKSNKSIVPCMTAHIIYNMISGFILFVLVNKTV